jgi:hypothetical protein
MENYMKIQHISHPLHGEHLLPECPLVRHDFNPGDRFTATKNTDPAPALGWAPAPDRLYGPSGEHIVIPPGSWRGKPDYTSNLGGSFLDSEVNEDLPQATREERILKKIKYLYNKWENRHAF